MSHRDSTAFMILVEEHTPMLMTFIRAMVFDAQAAEDVFQDTMVTAWRRLEAYDSSRPFPAWIRGIARNHALEYYRDVRRRPSWCTDEVLAELDGRIEQLTSRPGDTWEEKLAVLGECLEALPEGSREVLDLHYRDSMTTEAIASSTGARREAIKKRLQRARTWLADCLKRKAVFPSDLGEARA